MNAATILPGLDGIRLPNGTRRPDLHHASKGGHPYPKEIREQVIGIWQIAGGGDAGLAALKTPPIQALRAQGKFPHINTCKRWIVIFQDEDHVQPKRHTGNNYSKREIHGVDLVNLAFFPDGPSKSLSS